MVFQRSDDIDENDLLTWEVQLRREGTLPPQVQECLLEALRLAIAENGSLLEENLQLTTEVGNIRAENERLLDESSRLSAKIGDLQEEIDRLDTNITLREDD